MEKSMTEIFISSVLLPWMITTCHMTFDAIISITFGPVVAFLYDSLPYDHICVLLQRIFCLFNFSMLIRI